MSGESTDPKSASAPPSPPAPRAPTSEEVGIGAVKLSPRAELLGKRYAQTLAQEEAGYCRDLMRTHAAPLAKQGIGPRQVTTLGLLASGLPLAEQGVETCTQAQMRLTTLVANLLDTATDDVMSASNACGRALESTAPEALEAFPLVGDARQSVGTTVEVCQKAAGFVATWAQLLREAGEDPVEMVERLRVRVREVIAANEAQESAKRETQAAASLAAQIRGQIYVLTGQVYKAGRTAFREEASIKPKFKYQKMKSKPKPKGPPPPAEPSDAPPEAPSSAG